VVDWNLTVTGRSTGWTEAGAVRTKAEIYVVAALELCLRRYPGKVICLHADNGSEFMNGHLVRFCRALGITLTPEPFYPIPPRMFLYPRGVLGGALCCAGGNPILVVLLSRGCTVVGAYLLLVDRSDGCKFVCYQKKQLPPLQQSFFGRIGGGDRGDWWVLTTFLSRSGTTTCRRRKNAYIGSCGAKGKASREGSQLAQPGLSRWRDLVSRRRYRYVRAGSDCGFLLRGRRVYRGSDLSAVPSLRS